MINNLPIGVFDSGLGGLTVVHQIQQLLPNEDIVYLGDTARVPYGTRGEEVIKKFSDEDLNFLLSKDVKCVVIACHTASAVAGKYLKDKHPQIKIFEVISPTIEYTKKQKGITAVLATRATVNSRAFSSKLNSVDLPCPLFVPCIEEGETKGELIELLIKRYIKGSSFDNLILGCTHYPIIEKTIRQVVGDNVNIINPGVCVAEEIDGYFRINGLKNVKKTGGSLQLFVTDLNPRFIGVAEMFLGKQLNKEIKKVVL
jgi:glutamate racemase